MWVILLAVIPLVPVAGLFAMHRLGVDSSWALVAAVAVPLVALGLLAVRLGRHDHVWGSDVPLSFAMTIGAFIMAGAALRTYQAGDASWATICLAMAAALGIVAMISRNREIT